jgi:hypothetical protein
VLSCRSRLSEEHQVYFSKSMTLLACHLLRCPGSPRLKDANQSAEHQEEHENRRGCQQLPILTSELPQMACSPCP